MPRRRIRLSALAVLGLVLLALWWWRSDGSDQAGPARDSSRLLYDRVWVDSLPEKHTDYMHAMLVLRDAPVGVFQKASSYHAILEVFEHQKKGKRLRVFFPQTRTQKGMKFRIHECDELPPFDLCLDLEKNPWGGPKRYYSTSDADDELEAIGSAMRTRLERAGE